LGMLLVLWEPIWTCQCITDWLRIVFQTELLGIQGVDPPPVVEAEAETVSTETEEGEGVAEKVASVVADAADAAKTIIADTDDQGHEEL
jgi:FK506-binding protein 2